MRRSPMPHRKTPLRSSSSLRSSGSLHPVSRRRAGQNRARTETLRPLREAQTWCSRCGVTGVGLDAHELLSRARGGSITDPANIVLLCRRCHDDVTFRHHEIPDADRWIHTREAS